MENTQIAAEEKLAIDSLTVRQPADKAVLVHSFIERHLKGGADNYAIALLLEKAGYTFRDLADALIASRGM